MCPPRPSIRAVDLDEFCLGFTGAVTEVRDGPDERVLTGLPSIFSEASGEALGPSDIAFTGGQKFVLSIGLGGSDEFRAAFGPDGALLGTLVSGKIKRDEHSLFADVLANEAAANPDGTDIDSNPVGLVRQGEGYLVADAEGNAVVRVSHKGTFRTIAALPPGARWLLPSSGYRRAPRSPPMRCRPQWCRGQTARTTSAS